MPVRLLVERYCHQMHTPASRQKPYSYLIHARHSVLLRVRKVLLTERYATSQRSVQSHEWGRRYDLLSLNRVPTLNNKDGTGCLMMQPSCHLAAGPCRGGLKRTPPGEGRRCHFWALVRASGSFRLPLEYSGSGGAKTRARKNIGHGHCLKSFSVYTASAYG